MAIKKYIKFQSVAAPNGLVANLFGPVEGRRHDSAMLARSGLLGHLKQHTIEQNGSILCIYGDPAYPLRPPTQKAIWGSTNNTSSGSMKSGNE